MDALLNTTLVCFALLIGLVVFAVVAGSRRSESDWKELSQSDRDFKRKNSDGATFEPDDHFLDKALDFKPPALYPYELNSKGEIDPIKLQVPDEPKE